MNRKIVGVALIAVFLLFGAGLAAHAEEPGPAATGTLTAEGDGFVGLRARGTVEIEGQGSGVIWVHEGTVVSEGSGERFDLPRGNVLLVAWSGKVTASGERVGLRLISHSVQLTASGAGVATLHGSGTYETEKESGEWTVEGARVRFGLPAVVEGKGTLSASGSGEALLRGRGRVEIQSHGEGVIRIRGAAKIEVEGQEQAEVAGLRPRQRALPGRPVVLRDVEGRVVAEGLRLEVAMRSSQIEFTATGQGLVVLRGEGTYEVGGEEGSWSENGTRIRIGEE